ncbi:MAG: hypothetical protein DCC58_19310 [Chloroflexi bacterium]|nr:MAG: hypothetical protein DCC58_19310 [Chloroflexota bacterium]
MASTYHARYRIWLRGLPVLVLIASFVLASCGDEASADEPPDIEYGKTECTRCHMIISDERFAAGLVDADGKAQVFDDIGELITVVQEEGLGSSRAWVHDYDTKEWIDATQAHYVVSMDVVTPMGSGVSAFTTSEAANTFAMMRMGEIMTWDEMLTGWKMKDMHP